MSAKFEEDLTLVDTELAVPLLTAVCPSIIVCSMLCLHTIGCFGFSFKEKAGVCRLHNEFLTLKTALGTRVWKAAPCYTSEARPSVYCSASCYCINVINLDNTWDGAKNFCSTDGSYLAKVDTKDKLEFALYVMYTFTNVNYWWVGGNKETTSQPYKWLDGSLIDTGVMRTDNNGPCVGIWGEQRTLDDAFCSSTVKFICQI